nr:unnamed protein product [Callosobruchus analis]
MYKLHPPMPRYDSTWDPDIVLNYLKTFYPNETISLEKLAKKTVTLLALITAHKVHTLSLIDINNICKNCKRFKTRTASRIRTSLVNRLQPCLCIPYFLEDRIICAATTLERTNQYREGNSKLCLTYKRPIKEATSQSISRWIKSVLLESGIDSSFFSAHSTRHASTSAARCRGLNLDLIRKTTTFAKFYHRPLNQD